MSEGAGKLPSGSSRAIRGRVPLFVVSVALILLASCAHPESSHHESRKTVEVSGHPDTVKITVPIGPGTEYRPQLADWEVEALRRRGLANPAYDLRHDLERHRELIPFKGVEGGTMGFYDTTSIFVLNDRWVYAEFEDGHVGGSGIFEFHVEPGGKIQWKVVKAAMGDY